MRVAVQKAADGRAKCGWLYKKQQMAVQNAADSCTKYGKWLRETLGKWVTTAAEKRKKKQAGKPDKGWKENERRIYQGGGSDAGD